MSRPLKIFLYFLSFSIIMYVSVILMVRASYFIPVNTSGADLDRSYSLLYLFLFGIFAVIFGLVGAYAYLSNLGKKTSKEVFQYNKKKFVFVVTFLAIGLFYFIFELLFGYIILNYNNPSLNVNNTYMSIMVSEDKSFKELDYSSKINNSNEFIVNGVTSGFYNSTISHYGNGMHQIVGNNTIIKALLKSSVVIDKCVLSTYGKYSEALYIEDSTLNVSNSSINVSGENSVALFSDSGIVNITNTKISSKSNYVLVLRNDTFAVFDSIDFNINRNTNELIYLSSDNSKESINVFLKNIKSDTPDYDFFKIDKTKAFITIENSEINWDSLNEYFAYMDDSSVEVHLKNSKLIGDINIDMDSEFTIRLENSTYEGEIKTINPINLSIDDVSEFKTKSKLTISNYNGSEEKKNNLVDYIEVFN